MIFALFAAATAALPVDGDHLRIFYGDAGMWNNSATSKGFQVDHEGRWVDWSYAGEPYHLLAVEWDDGDENRSFYASSSSGTNGTVTIEKDASNDVAAVAIHQWNWNDGEEDVLVVDRIESWIIDERAVRVELTITNTSAVDWSDLRLLYAVDPDPDGEYYATCDTLDLDEDGAADWAESVSTDGYTLGFSACDLDGVTLGHFGSWYGTTDADRTITDYGATSADDAMAFAWDAPARLKAGESVSVTFLVVAADTGTGAQLDAIAAGEDLCGPCDGDGDEHDKAACGGDDCDDADPESYLGADEIWYDGVDQDCLGDSDTDRDGDGYDAVEAGGDDCLDTNPDANPGQTEDTWYDGVDSDCDGASDFDQDGDGADSDQHGGEDCEDLDPEVGPDAAEIWYDDVDQDCDGNDQDQDADGFDVDVDCDDEDGGVYPNAEDIPDDGVDQDCEGGDASGEGVSAGCGCASGGPAAGLLAGLLALGALRRRRA